MLRSIGCLGRGYGHRRIIGVKFFSNDSATNFLRTQLCLSRKIEETTRRANASVSEIAMLRQWHGITADPKEERQKLNVLQESRAKSQAQYLSTCKDDNEKIQKLRSSLNTALSIIAQQQAKNKGNQRCFLCVTEDKEQCFYPYRGRKTR